MSYSRELKDKSTLELKEEKQDLYDEIDRLTYELVHNTSKIYSLYNTYCKNECFKKITKIDAELARRGQIK